MTMEQEAGVTGTASTKHLMILAPPCLSPELKPPKVLSWPDLPEDGSISSLCFLEVSRRLKGAVERMQDRDGFSYHEKQMHPVQQRPPRSLQKYGFGQRYPRREKLAKLEKKSL